MQTNFVSDISFNSYTNEEIKKIALIEIYNPKTIDRDLKPVLNGCHDIRLGPLNYQDTCVTCGCNYFLCPGHPGFIDLPLIIYNPSFLKILFSIIKGSCPFCQNLLAPSTQIHIFIQKIILCNNETNKNTIEYTNNLIHDYIKKYHLSSFIKTCMHCHLKLPNWKLKEGRIHYSFVHKKRSKTDHVNSLSNHLININAKGDQELNPEIAKKLLTLIFSNSSNLNLLKFLYGCIKKNLQGEVNEELVEKLSNLFFIKNLPIIPSKFRPLNSLGDSKFVNGQTLVYTKILAACQLLKEVMRLNDADGINQQKLLKSKRLSNKFLNNKMATNYESIWRYLQSCVNLILNIDTKLFPKEKLISMRQILEKKEGLFRKHMMGKRVDFAARSVISPDPFINLDQIGVPMTFATRLTFPEAVTPYNINRLSKYVINGPQHYPGAFSVKTAKGDILFLPPNNPTQRALIARRLTSQSPSPWLLSSTSPAYNAFDNFNVEDYFPPSTLPKSFTINNSYERDRIVQVNRHIIDGDILLLNRQPTLHKPSIMAHKAKVLTAQKTLRLHYAHCKAYNADFDGDEMNAHFPQDLLGVAEGRFISGCQDNYLTPKDGTPLTGLIQDYLVAGVLLSQRNQFFNKHDYHDLLYKAFAENTTATCSQLKLLTLKPAIIKPVKLWTGKQLISSILINSIGVSRASQFNLYTPKCKVSEDMYKYLVHDSNQNTRLTMKSQYSQKFSLNAKHHLSENGTCIRGGYWIRGIFDKSHFGASSYGLVHSCQELYGGQISSNLLTTFAKMLTFYLRLHGFTLGIKDLLVSPKADKKRKKELKTCSKLTDISSNKNSDIYDSKLSTRDNILLKVFDKQQNFLMNKDSFKKEELLNNLFMEWRRAFYERDDYVLSNWEFQSKHLVDSLNNSITEQIMNGLVKQFPLNNLLLMVNSGAKGSLVNCVQICSMLGQIELEGKRPAVLPTGRSLPSFQPFDPNPKTRGFVTNRFLTGLKPQDYFFHCMAGREGLIDTAVKTSHSGYLQRCLIKQLEGVKVYYDSTVRDADDTIVQFLYGEDGLEVCKCQYLKDKQQLDFLLANHNSSSINYHQNKSIIKDLKHSRSDCSEQLKNAIKNNYQDIALKLSPKSTSKTVKKRKLLTNPDQFCSNNCNYPVRDFPPGGYKSIKSFFKLKNFQSAISPGEAAGVLAAQSIGEPSTQMTLNTFHFAGRGEMNVTLGIPRLREILMTATQDLKTPVMTVPFSCKGLATELKLIFSRIPFSKVLKSIDINETIETSPNINLKKINWNYRFSFQLLPPECLSLILPQTILSKTNTKASTVLEQIFTDNTTHLRDTKLSKKLRKSLCNFVCSRIEKYLLPRLVKAIRKEDAMLNNIKLFESRKKFRSFASSSHPKVGEGEENNEEDEDKETDSVALTKAGKGNSKSTNSGSSEESSASEDESNSVDGQTQVLVDIEDGGEELGDDVDNLSQTTNETRTTSTTVTKDYPLHDAYGSSEEDGESMNKSVSYGNKRKIQELQSPQKLLKSNKKKSSYLNKYSLNITTIVDDSGAEHDFEDDNDREHRAGSMPSSTTSGFSEMGGSLLNSSNLSGDDNHHNNQNSPTKINKPIAPFKIRDMVDGYLTNFIYDAKIDPVSCEIVIQVPLSENKVDMEAILEKECKSYIYEITGIHSSSISDNGLDNQTLNIEGINFAALFQYGRYVELDKLYCNNLHHILEMYGIEACRNAIIKEIQKVFLVYGIKVDYRHLSLVADFMTTSGYYKAFNRFSFANNASPFLKMSFESTTNFLLDALISGSTDNLQTPSACLVMGKDMTAGTGSFELFQDLTR